MSEDEKKTLKLYKEQYQKFGNDRRSLFWTKDRSFLRFKHLVKNWDLNKKQILDFGCGFGDLRTYLLKEGINDFDYHGIDICEDFILHAQSIHKDAKFTTTNLFQLSDKLNYDVVVVSGTFNTRVTDNYALLQESFEKFMRISEEGFAVNFISDLARNDYPEIFYYSHSKVLELALSFSNRIILDNSYMPFEFTINVFKKDRFDGHFMVYEDQLQNLSSDYTPPE